MAPTKFNVSVLLVFGFLLVFDLYNLGVSASTKSSRKAKVAVHTPQMGTPNMAELQIMNLENAIKIYLAARGVLTPVDLTTNASPAPRVHHQHGAKKAPTPPPCVLPEGCVTGAAKLAFLKSKYIPGNDNILSPYYQVPGHLFAEADPAAVDVLNADFRLYLMSRPRNAVPDASRQLLMPEGDDAWPGGQGGDRTPYYPKIMLPGQSYWETDIDPIRGADNAMPSPPATPKAPDTPPKPVKIEVAPTEEEKDEETVKEIEEVEEEIEEVEKELDNMGDMSPDEVFDLMVWLFVVMSMILIPLVLACICRSFYSRPDQSKRLDMARKRLRTLMA